MATKTVKPAPAHPSYKEMIGEALFTLKDRSGSSIPALKKAISGKYEKELKEGWEKKLSLYLKKFAASGDIVKVKSSYKLSEDLKKSAKAGFKKPAVKKVVKKKTEKKVVKKPAAKKTTKPTTTKPKVKKTKTPTKAKKAAKPAAKKTTKAKKATGVKKTVKTKKAAK